MCFVDVTVKEKKTKKKADGACYNVHVESNAALLVHYMLSKGRTKKTITANLIKRFPRL